MPKSTSSFRPRHLHSPYSAATRKKTQTDDERLDDIGRVSHLPSSNIPPDVVSLISHVRDTAFEPMPDRAAGMNSERIADTLNFRSALPPLVSTANVLARTTSPTDIERQLARLMAEGEVRKIAIPGRGKGGSAVGEAVVLVEAWRRRLRQDATIADDIKEKYVSLMNTYPTSQTVAVGMLSQAELRSLVSAGFLTNPAALSASVGNLFARPTGVEPGSIARAGSSAATGTFGAVGGYGSIQISGGGGSRLATKDNRPSPLKPGREMTFSLPSTGAYLKLLIEARTHLLFLLKQLSPKFKEATKDMLEEKWNGNVPTDNVSKAKRLRGEWSGVLPGQTRRWRQFYGLTFDWVLAECLGSGLIELFDTGSVGLGVRAT